MDDIPLPPNKTNISEEPSRSPNGNMSKVAETKKSKYGVRDWDKGKLGYTKWISSQREERNEEFRPPKFY